jgi:hypothetical protein
VQGPLREWGLESRHLGIGLLILGIGLIAVASGVVILVATRRWPPRRAVPQDPRRSPLFDRELDGLL